LTEGVEIFSQSPFLCLDTTQKMANPYKIKSRVEYISRRTSGQLSVIAYVPMESQSDIRQAVMDIFRRLALEPRYSNVVSFGLVEIHERGPQPAAVPGRFELDDLPKIVVYRSGGSSVFELESLEFQKIKIAIDLALEQ
jgi:hypothetical protein